MIVSLEWEILERPAGSEKVYYLPIKNVSSLSGNSKGEKMTPEAKYDGILLNQKLNELISSDNVFKIRFFLIQMF